MKKGGVWVLDKKQAAVVGGVRDYQTREQLIDDYDSLSVTRPLCLLDTIIL